MGSSLIVFQRLSKTLYVDRLQGVWFLYMSMLQLHRHTRKSLPFIFWSWCYDFFFFFFIFLSFPFKASWYSIRFLMTGFLNKITFIKTSSIQLLWFLDIKFESRTVAPITYAIYFFLFFPLFSFFLFTKFFFRFSLDLLFSGFLTYLILKLQNTKLVEQGNLILTGL